MATDPPIIVADEPTGNLDSRTADSVINLFERLVSGGKTILMVTHDDDLAARATRTVTIADGAIVSDDTHVSGHTRVFDDTRTQPVQAPALAMPTVHVNVNGTNGFNHNGTTNGPVYTKNGIAVASAEEILHG